MRCVYALIVANFLIRLSFEVTISKLRHWFLSSCVSMSVNHLRFRNCGDLLLSSAMFKILRDDAIIYVMIKFLDRGRVSSPLDTEGF